MLPLVDRRRAIAKTVGEEIPTSYVIATAPDHPLLIEGPDILIGGEGNLVAVFTPKASERADDDRLLARFILCRLALRSGTFRATH